MFKLIANDGNKAVAENVETGELWELTEFMFVETDEEGMLEGFYDSDDMLECGWELVAQ